MASESTSALPGIALLHMNPLSRIVQASPHAWHPHAPAVLHPPGMARDVNSLFSARLESLSAAPCARVPNGQQCLCHSLQAPRLVNGGELPTRKGWSGLSRFRLLEENHTHAWAQRRPRRCWRARMIRNRHQSPVTRSLGLTPYEERHFRGRGGGGRACGFPDPFS